MGFRGLFEFEIWWLVYSHHFAMMIQLGRYLDLRGSMVVAFESWLPLLGIKYMFSVLIEGSPSWEPSSLCFCLPLWVNFVCVNG